MKVLINTPNWKKPELGGVANHYYGLRPYWSENVRYNIIGSRVRPNTGKYWLPWDIIKTTIKILFFNPDVVIVNTSLGRNALKRDSIFLNLANLFRKKVVVHFHGFNVNYAKEIDTQWYLRLYKNASGYLVLSNAIKKSLQDWGVTAPIYLTTTKVDDRLIEGIGVSGRNGKIKNILYLGRVEKEKGIYISLDVYSLLQQKDPSLQFTVVGGGTELNNAIEYAKKIGLHNITFTGPLTGKELQDQYKKADLYLFTSYHEGMPTSVLEAMCFGLPVITRPVGGLVDFFENGRMGEMIDSFEAADFVEPIEELMLDKERTKSIMRYNQQYGTQRFLASKVASNIETRIKEIVG